MIVTGDFRRGRHPGDPEPFLARSRLLRKASVEARAQLARFARRVAGLRGDRLYGPDAPPEGLFIVASGHVALSLQDGEARDNTVEICGPGDVLGEDCLVAAACPLTARMASAGLLVCLPRQAVLAAMERYPDIAASVLRSISHRILQATHQIGGGATRPGAQRLAGYLLCNVAAGDTAASIVLAAPKRSVASLLGMSKETLSRLLGRLAARGLIEVRGRTIVVPSVPALAAFCHDGAGCASCWGCPRGGAWIA